MKAISLYSDSFEQDGSDPSSGVLVRKDQHGWYIPFGETVGPDLKIRFLEEPTIKSEGKLAPGHLKNIGIGKTKKGNLVIIPSDKEDKRIFISINEMNPECITGNMITIAKFSESYPYGVSADFFVILEPDSCLKLKYCFKKELNFRKNRYYGLHYSHDGKVSLFAKWSYCEMFLATKQKVTEITKL